MSTPTEPGRVESINVAVPRHDLPARAGATGIDKRPVAGPVRLDVGGVAGDTVIDLADHGGPDQAVYAYSVDDLEFWSAELGRRLGPGGVGENLTLSGVDCSGALIGERWQVGDAVLQVRAARTPCRTFVGFLDVPDLMKRFIAAGRPGAYLAVLHPGEVRAGDPVRVLDRPAHGVTTADLMAVKTIDRDRVERVAAAREHLGARARAWLDRTLAGRERTRAAATS
ncbi:MAG TPA: MOSC domain-containing protein [Pseudonocardia sp.]|nr:MOSC domain-containing protein [Pseudonocardia sp.]